MMSHADMAQTGEITFADFETIVRQGQAAEKIQQLAKKKALRGTPSRAYHASAANDQLSAPAGDRRAIASPAAVERLLAKLDDGVETSSLPSARVVHELSIEMRGTQGVRKDMWASLQRIHEIVHRVLEDFPGVLLEPLVTCPMCLAVEQQPPYQFELSAATSKQVKCEYCSEVHDFFHTVTSDGAPPPSAMHLVMCPHQGQSRANVKFPPLHKFVANRLRIGKPIEAHYRLHKLLGLPSEEALQQLRCADEAQLTAEIANAARTDEDDKGWTDADWLTYVQSDRAGRPSKHRTETLDVGHEGKLLDEFAQHPLAVAARLSRAHVLALRLYSTPLHLQLNEPFYNGCLPRRPHPYPILVVMIIEAWQRLAVAIHEKPGLFAKFGALGLPEDGPNGKPVFWRVFNSANDVGEYKQRGCLDMGFTSTFKARATAEKHALRMSRDNRSDRPILLKVRTDIIVDISPWSVYPAEGECILPPCTYFDLRSEQTVPSVIKLGEHSEIEVMFRFVEAVPTLLVLPPDPSNVEAAAQNPSRDQSFSKTKMSR